MAGRLIRIQENSGTKRSGWAQYGIVQPANIYEIAALVALAKLTTTDRNGFYY